MGLEPQKQHVVRLSVNFRNKTYHLCLAVRTGSEAQKGDANGPAASEAAIITETEHIPFTIGCAGSDAG